jgi:hypothetical protein
MDLQEIFNKILGGGTQPPVPPAGAPAPAPTVPQAGPPAAAPAAPPAPQQPPGMGAAPAATPPDLAAMYQDLLKQQRRDKLIDSGMTLVAAGFAKPQSRAALISQANGGGGGGSDPASTVNTLMGLQKAQEAKALAASQKLRLPMIAKKYGLDMDTVEYLHSTGKLDETVNSLAQPDNVIETRSDGSKFLFNKKTGKNLGDISPADKYYGYTNDLKELDRVNNERAARGQPTIPAETWLTDMAQNKATKVSTGDTLEKEAGKIRLKELSESGERARSGIEVANKLGEASEVLGRGIIAGSMVAEPAKEGRKILAQVFGLNDEAASNTDTFVSQMKEIVLPRVKALGTGNSISNADVKFVTEAVGASTNLTPETIHEIIRRMNRLERNYVLHHNERAGKFRSIKGNEGAGKYVDDIQMPRFNPAIAKPDHIAKLRADAANPETRDKITKYFNETYGAGAAESVLGEQ